MRGCRRLLVLVLVLPLGCGGPEQREGEFLTEDRLPFSVGIYVRDATPLPPGDSVDEVTLTAGPAEFARSLASALENDYPLVSRANVLAATSVDDALQEARDMDLLMALGLGVPPRFEVETRPAEMVALEIVLWLFGGIPSWFVPSVTYATPLAVSLEVLDLNRQAVRERPEGDQLVVDSQLSLELENEALSLWQRSDITERPLDYLQTVIMPPMFVVPGDPVRAGESLTEKLSAQLGESLSAPLKKELLAIERASPLRVLLHPPQPGVQVRGRSLVLSFEVVSSDAVPLTALDVYRLAEGFQSERWVPTSEDLQSFNQALAAAGRVKVSLPRALPLVPGENIIKVRALRRDGERVSRTVVYRFEESE